MRIPLALGVYDRLDLPRTYLKNLFYEKALTNQKDQVALIGRPALAAFATAGSGPIYGLFKRDSVILNRTLCLSGDDLYTISDLGVATLILANLTSNQDAIMTAEGTEDVALINTGKRTYQTDGVTASELTLPDATWDNWAVDYLAGRFLFVTRYGRFYWTDAGTLTIDALNFATAEVKADYLETLRVVRDELWLFGRESVEVWEPTSDTDLPFSKVPGRHFDMGCAGRNTVVKIMGSLFFVGRDRRVYRTNANPEVISDAYMDDVLVDAADAGVGVHVNFGGHDLYVLNIGTSGSFAYDIATGQWTELTSQVTGFGERKFRAFSSFSAVPRQFYVGDSVATGKVYLLDEDGTTDVDGAITYEWTGVVEGPGRCSAVRLHASTLLAPDAQDDAVVEFRYSDDDGRTWSDWIPATLNGTGTFGEMAVWDRLGQMRHRRLFHWRTTQRVTVRGADLNEGWR